MRRSTLWRRKDDRVVGFLTSSLTSFLLAGARILMQ
jgi:hypothetical protein